jgi:hypothetical protein
MKASVMIVGRLSVGVSVLGAFGRVVGYPVCVAAVSFVGRRCQGCSVNWSSFWATSPGAKCVLDVFPFAHSLLGHVLPWLPVVF